MARSQRVTASHIYLTRSGGGEGATILFPIATTIFAISGDLDTLAITASGTVYKVDEALLDIEEALDVVRLGD